MAVDKRRNFKSMKADQQQRFIKAIKRMKSHTSGGTASSTGGSYQQYVEWHRGMTTVNFAELFNYSASTTGTLTSKDTFISIKIDGQVKKPSKPISLSTTGLITSFLNGLYDQTMAGNPAIGRFAVSNSSGTVTINCTNAVYEPQEFICKISGTNTTFSFTKGSTKVGDLQLTTMRVAHFGSLFLPWHRAFIRLFELDLQKADEQVLTADLGSAAKKDTYIKKHGKLALPYWKWEIDNSKDPKASKGYLWKDTLMGGDGNSANTTQRDRLESGPFKFSDWALHGSSPTYLTRQLGRLVVRGRSFALPVNKDVVFLNKRNVYDVHPFNNGSSTKSFRQVLEGWSDIPSNANPASIPAELHNVVHMWVGGTMANVPIAPNDPVFFLNHCNVDRLWSRWQKNNRTADQYPAFGPVPGRRKNDEMIPWRTGSAIGAIRAADVLRHRPFPSSIQSILGEGYRYI